MDWPSIRRETDRPTALAIKLLCAVGIFTALFGLFVGPGATLVGALANAPLIERVWVLLVGIGLLALAVAQIYALVGLLR